MAWFKVDDALAFHPKVIAAGNAAMGLWVRCGSYCAQFETDGWLNLGTISALGGHKRDIDRLVAVHLWVREGDGVRFRDWADYQPTKAQKDAERSATADRVRAFRDRERNGVTPAVSNATGTPVPSRPVPSRPDPVTPNGVTVSPRRSPESRLPEAWEPTDTHRNKAAELRLDIDREAEKFRDHAAANDRRARNWDAAFRTWLTKAAEYAARDASRPTPRTSDRQGLILQEEMRRAREHDAAQTRWEIEA